MENLLIIGGIFKIYGFLRNKVLEITFIIKNNGKNKKNKSIITCIENIVFNPLIFFSLYYISKIVTIFIGNQIILSFIHMISLFIKELSKYLIFFLLSLILYSLEKFVFENEREDAKATEEIVKINQV